MIVASYRYITVFLFCIATRCVAAAAAAAADIAASSSDVVECGPNGNIIINATSSLAAQWICDSTQQQPADETTVQIAILSRPLLPNEATTTDDFHFTCSQPGQQQEANPTTIVQAEVALDAFVLVVAKNGTAEYCLNELYNNQLTLGQLRILFSNRTFNITDNNSTTATSPSTPKPSIFSTQPSILVTSLPPVIPTPLMPSVHPEPTSVPSVDPRKIPAFSPNFRPPPTAKRPTRQPARRPSRKTPRPTLPTATRRSVYWGFILNPAGSFSFCQSIEALVAGLPVASELYQEFFQRILPDYGKGEDVVSQYFGDTADEVITFLQKNPNAIAFMSLADYAENQDFVSLVGLVGTANGTTNTSYFPNSTNLISNAYPLAFNLSLAARSEPIPALRRLYSFINYAFSARGDGVLAKSGLLAIPYARKDQILSILSDTISMSSFLGGNRTVSPTTRRTAAPSKATRKTAAPSKAIRKNGKSPAPSKEIDKSAPTFAKTASVPVRKALNTSPPHEKNSPARKQAKGKSPTARKPSKKG